MQFFYQKELRLLQYFGIHLFCNAPIQIGNQYFRTKKSEKIGYDLVKCQLGIISGLVEDIGNDINNDRS